MTPDPSSITVPFDTQLQPWESVTAMRRFDQPNDARGPSLIYNLEIPFPIGFFIAGAKRQVFPRTAYGSAGTGSWKFSRPESSSTICYS